MYEYKGWVTAIDGDVISAIVIDEENNRKFDVEFPKSKIKTSQQHLLSKGILFDIKLYEHTSTNRAIIDLRKPVDFTPEELENARLRAEELYKHLNWD